MQATPVSNSRASVAVDNKVYPQCKTIDGVKQDTRLRSYVLPENTLSDVQLVFQNSEGNPYDLTGIAGTFECVAVEAVCGGRVFTFPVTVSEAATGLLSIPLSLPAGVYHAEVRLKEADVQILVNSFVIYVSMAVTSRTGPPSLMEIRLQLRDFSADESSLIDSIAFPDEEILSAAVRALNYFNEQPPTLDMPYSTHNFPWRYHWIEGILGGLFEYAAEDFRRNQLNYQAGGLSVADKDKERNYTEAAARHWGTFMRFVRYKKGEINMDACFRRLG